MTAPMFSVVTPVYNPPVGALREMVASVLAQTYGSFELILVDDCSPDAEVRTVLHELAAADRRIVLVEREKNGGIVAASNTALEQVRGEFVVLVDHDDLIEPQALARVRERLDAEPEIDYLYTNEDKVDDAGRRFDVFLKPDWSPERLRGQMYTSHLSVLRTELVRAVGGFRPGFEGSQDHDLVLRVVERARQVAHVPEVLYHWRAHPGSTAANYQEKSYAWLAGQRAVQDHVDRVGIRATVELGELPGTYRLDRRAPSGLSVSVVIPTNGSAGMVWGEERVYVVECVRSLLERLGGVHLEVVVVYDEPSTPGAVLEELEEIAGASLVLVPYRRPFNFSQKCNVGFLAATGDVVVLLNDDLQVVSDGFLEQLVAPLSEPDVGMTGARLLFADGTLQHGGHQYSRGDITHVFLGADGTWGGPFSELTINRECSGLTAAAAALRREVFEEVGGFCEALPGNFNDVDLSRKVGSAGYRMVWVAGASAYHFESRTREPSVRRWEYENLLARWDFSGDDRYMPVSLTGAFRERIGR
ncbi:glycosyltransferase [Georgenia sp. EYE_87]|uniref:glycosyltransferase family 2 protein n=1 Tax=Georgenia sp. EYE_87 TaxID=2853448 RepID=UPI002003F279|nr:glycosyltransferase [Georgenia sp. EYE_87]MCK6211773.1 glycosyltransferase [Georgenia sp. EYE_87]